MATLDAIMNASEETKDVAPLPRGMHGRARTRTQCHDDDDTLINNLVQDKLYKTCKNGYSYSEGEDDENLDATFPQNKMKNNEINVPKLIKSGGTWIYRYIEREDNNDKNDCTDSQHHVFDHSNNDIELRPQLSNTTITIMTSPCLPFFSKQSNRSDTIFPVDNTCLHWVKYTNCNTGRVTKKLTTSVDIYNILLNTNTLRSGKHFAKHDTFKVNRNFRSSESARKNSQQKQDKFPEKINNNNLQNSSPNAFLESLQEKLRKQNEQLAEQQSSSASFDVGNKKIVSWSSSACVDDDEDDYDPMFDDDDGMSQKMMDSGGGDHMDDACMQPEELPKNELSVNETKEQQPEMHTTKTNSNITNNTGCKFISPQEQAKMMMRMRMEPKNNIRNRGFKCTNQKSQTSDTTPPTDFVTHKNGRGNNTDDSVDTNKNKCTESDFRWDKIRREKNAYECAQVLAEMIKASTLSPTTTNTNTLLPRNTSHGHTNVVNMNFRVTGTDPYHCNLPLFRVLVEYGNGESHLTQTQSLDNVIALLKQMKTETILAYSE